MKLTLGCLLLASSLYACPTGCVEYNGICACDAKPEAAPDAAKPSDEKPSRNPVPAYMRESVKADMGKRAISVVAVSEDAAAKLPNGGVPER